MREPQDLQVGGRTYSVTPLPAGKGLAVMQRVSKCLGPALGKLASDQGALAAAVGEITERMSAEDLDWLCRTMAATTMVHEGGKQLSLERIFDVHFAGEYDVLVDWLVHCFKVNFGPLVAKLGLRAKPVPSTPAP
jgi:hypothetical protein